MPELHFGIPRIAQEQPASSPLIIDRNQKSQSVCFAQSQTTRTTAMPFNLALGCVQLISFVHLLSI